MHFVHARLQGLKTTDFFSPFFFTLGGKCTYYKHVRCAFGLGLWHMWYFLTFGTSTKHDQFYPINLLPCLLKQEKHNLTCNALKYSAHLHKISSSFTLMLMQCYFRMLFWFSELHWTALFFNRRACESQMVSFTIFKLSWVKVILMLLFLSGIKNPVLVARRLLSETQKGKLSAGRIPPWWAELSDVGFRHIDGLTYFIDA